MKVLLALSWYFPESTGGTEVYVASLAKYLKVFGCEPVIAAPLKTDKISRYFHEGIPVFRYPIPADPTRNEVQERLEPHYFGEYVKLLNELKPDIAHFHTTSWAMGNPHLRVAKAIGCRVVVTCHTPAQGYLCPRGTNMIWGKRICDGIVKPARCSACVLQSKGIPPFLGFPLSWASGWPRYIRHRLAQQKELFSLADKLLVLSDGRREIFLRNGSVGEGKISLCRLAVSQETSQTNHKSLDKEIVVGYIGRMDPIKGLDGLIKAFGRIRSQALIRLKVFAIAAEGDKYFESIKYLAKDDPRIEFCPSVKPEEIPSVFRQMDVLAVPSLCMEGGPTVLLEALACKVPVMGSNVSAISEYIQHGKNGLLFEPGDVNGIEIILNQLLSDRGLLPRLVEGIGAVRTMKQVAVEMRDLYLDLLRGK